MVISKPRVSQGQVVIVIVPVWPKVWFGRKISQLIASSGGNTIVYFIFCSTLITHATTLTKGRTDLKIFVPLCGKSWDMKWYVAFVLSVLHISFYINDSLHYSFMIFHLENQKSIMKNSVKGMYIESS